MRLAATGAGEAPALPFDQQLLTEGDMILWIGLALMTMALPAHAQIYQCEDDGSTVFQDQPCDGTGSAFTPSRDISIADGPGVESSASSERRLQERLERQRAENARYREYADKQHRVSRAEEDGRIIGGMTQEQVREIWGAPWESLAAYDQAGNRCVTWYYGGPARAERPEVTFCNGEVTTFRAYGR